MDTTIIPRHDSVPADLWDHTSHDNQVLCRAQLDLLEEVQQEQERFMSNSARVISDNRADAPGEIATMFAQLMVLQMKASNVKVGLDNIMWKMLWEHGETQRRLDLADNKKRHLVTTLVAVVSALAAVASMLFSACCHK